MVAVAQMDRAGACVARDEAGGASRVIRGARALHAENVRETSRRDGKVDASGGKDARACRRRAKDLREVERLDANEHARAAILKG